MRFFCWDKDEGDEDAPRQIEAIDGEGAAVAFARRQDKGDSSITRRREVCVRWQGGRLEVYRVEVEMEPSYSAHREP